MSFFNKITKFYDNRNCKIEKKIIKNEESVTTIELNLRLFDKYIVNKSIVISQKVGNQNDYNVNNNLEKVLTEKLEVGLVNAEKFLRETLLDKCDNKKADISLT